MRLFSCPCCAAFSRNGFLASPADTGSSGGAPYPFDDLAKDCLDWPIVSEHTKWQVFVALWCVIDLRDLVRRLLTN